VQRVTLVAATLQPIITTMRPAARTSHARGGAVASVPHSRPTSGFAQPTPRATPRVWALTLPSACQPPGAGPLDIIMDFIDDVRNLRANAILIIGILCFAGLVRAPAAPQRAPAQRPARRGLAPSASSTDARDDNVMPAPPPPAGMTHSSRPAPTGLVPLRAHLRRPRARGARARAGQRRRVQHAEAAAL
jgi:hypothetical protein